MKYSDFVTLEHPRITSIAVQKATSDRGEEALRTLASATDRMRRRPRQRFPL